MRNQLLYIVSLLAKSNRQRGELPKCDTLDCSPMPTGAGHPRETTVDRMKFDATVDPESRGLSIDSLEKTTSPIASETYSRVTR